MEQKFLITDSQKEVQDLIDKGWMIVSVTAQHVSNAVVGHDAYYSNAGKFAIVLERKN